MNAMERLNKMMKQKNSRICAGINPEFEKLPTELKEKNISKEEAIFEFCREYINTIYDYVSAVKINVAFFETKNLFPIYREIAKYAKNLGLFVIGDLKEQILDLQQKLMQRIGSEQKNHLIALLSIHILEQTE